MMDVMSMLTAHTLPASHNIPSAQSQPTDTTRATKTEEMDIDCISQESLHNMCNTLPINN